MNEKELEIVKSSLLNALAEIKQGTALADISEAYLSFSYVGTHTDDVPTIIRVKT